MEIFGFPVDAGINANIIPRQLCYKAQKRI